MEKIPMTRAGFTALDDELMNLGHTVKMPKPSCSCNLGTCVRKLFEGIRF